MCYLFGHELMTLFLQYYFYLIVQFEKYFLLIFCDLKLELEKCNT